MIIEFNGLPGCGKTTISKELYNSIQAKGNTVVFYNDIREKFPTGIIKRIKQMIHGWSIREVVYLYNISNCFDGVHFIEKWKRILYVEQIAYNYRKIMGDKRICVADQGLVQGVISIGYIYSFKSDKFRIKFEKYSHKFLSAYFDNTLIVNINISPAESMTRLRSRERNYGRFDSIKEDSEVLEGLKKQIMIFDVIRDRCLCRVSKLIELNGFDPPQKNVGAIIELVDSL